MDAPSYRVKPAASPTGTDGEGSVVVRDPDNAVLVALADAIAEAGDDRLSARLARLIELATGYESAVFVGYFTNGGAVPIYSNLSQDDERRTLDPYFEGAYLLDPWYNMIRDGVPDGVYRLSECAPDDFTRTDYYREYYANVGLEDEFALFVRLNEAATLVLSIGTRQGRRPLEGGFSVLSALLACIGALCVRRWGALSRDGKASPQSLEELCVQIGLSEREIEVTTLLLRGYSNKVIARNLDISPETVKVYRKRINKKLGTSSTREVFARFFPTSRFDAAPSTPA